MQTTHTLLFLVGFLTLYACKEKNATPIAPVVDELSVTMQPMFGTSFLALDQPYSSPEGYLVQFTDIKCYFTTLKNGSSSLCQAALFDYRTTGKTVFKAEGLPSSYPSLTAFLGVDSSQNHLDPSTFPNTNPLNITLANDMHWDWNPGYIFLKIEAKVDTIPADGIDQFNHFVVFHIGTDLFRQSLSFSNLNWVATSAHLYTLPLKVDMQQFLQNGATSINLKTEYTSHSSAGQEALSLKVIQQFKNAISPY